MFCENCGAYLEDNATSCPSCGCVVQSKNNQAQANQGGEYYQPNQQSQGQEYYQPNNQGQQYYQPNQNQQYNPYQQQSYVNQNEISSVRTLGVLGIILGIFFPLIGWILGGIGNSKANKLMFTAQTQEDVYAVNKAKGKCKTALIVSTVFFVLSFISSFALLF